MLDLADLHYKERKYNGMDSYGEPSLPSHLEVVLVPDSCWPQSRHHLWHHVGDCICAWCELVLLLQGSQSWQTSSSLRSWRAGRRAPTSRPTPCTRVNMNPTPCSSMLSQMGNPQAGGRARGTQIQPGRLW